MAGGWEFPGGKVDAGEAAFDALVRELREELAVAVIGAQQVIAYAHQYADRSVLLDLWCVTRYEGTPISAEGQPLRWVTLKELNTVGLLEADRPMLEPLRAVATKLGYLA
jgi:8-oxo-dGTP diphosphatase